MGTVKKSILVLSFTVKMWGVEFKNTESNAQQHQSASMWLTKTTCVNPMGKNRMIFETSLSQTKNRNGVVNQFCSNFDFGIRVTNNLTALAKIFGVTLQDQSAQVIGAGFQYYFGNKDTLKWILCIQRNDVKEPNNKDIESLTLDIRRWINYKAIRFRLGIGSSFFKQKLYDEVNFLIYYQDNFLAADFVVPISGFNFGANFHLTSIGNMSSIFFQKEFH